MRPASQQRLGGFTLIELLVVITIIAILAAILFPVFSQAKSAAKRATSIANLKQIAASMEMYASDNEDHAPGVTLGAALVVKEEYWQKLQPYTKNLKVFMSPEDRFTNCDQLTTNLGGYSLGIPDRGCMGYGFNHKALSEIPTEFGSFSTSSGVSLSSIVRPSSTFTFGDSDGITLPMGHTLNVSLWGGMDLVPEANLLRWRISGQELTSTKQLRHGGQFQMAFADGHAKSVPFVALQTSFNGNPKYTLGLPADRSLDSSFCKDPEAKLADTTATCKDDYAIFRSGGRILP